MPRDVAAHLHDALVACQDIQQMVSGLSFEHYESDKRTRLAVERSFQIIGEALVALRRHSPEMIDAVTEADDVIRFRNVLVHAYFNLDKHTVWDSIQIDLPKLHAKLAALMREYEAGNE